MRATGKTMIILSALSALLGGAATADEIEVTQKNKEFTPGTITIAPGDTIVFQNEDPITHNMFSRSEGFEFNLKMQKPGELKKQTFDGPGEAVVRCAIHPKMKLIVKVVDEQQPVAKAKGGEEGGDGAEQDQ